ncbi:hypothetical protein [Melissospora conviva]|uniref:hypothetical protein n=1 Tax=Melissospora conviva TaxID=3388432 RepID=UPI003C1AA325
MSYTTPKPGPYRRIKDGALVQVVGFTPVVGGARVSGMAEVTVKATRLSYVRLENFWKKYEPAAQEVQR